MVTSYKINIQKLSLSIHKKNLLEYKIEKEYYSKISKIKIKTVTLRNVGAIGK